MKQALFFSAPWCAACVPVKLVWMRSIRKFPDIARQVMDVTDPEGQTAATRYGVQGLPTIALIENGEVHEMFSPRACAKMDETDYETKLFHWR